MEPRVVPTPDEIRAVYTQGVAAVIVLVEEQTKQIQVLAARVQALEDQLAKNSSKPPSSGGQKGPTGNRLEPVDKADHTELHPVTACQHCQVRRVSGNCAPVEQAEVFVSGNRSALRHERIRCHQRNVGSAKTKKIANRLSGGQTRY